MYLFIFKMIMILKVIEAPKIEIIVMINEIFIIIFNGVPGELGVFLQPSIQGSGPSAIEDIVTERFLHCKEAIVIIFLFRLIS